MPLNLTIQNITTMTVYQCLLELDQLGYLKPLIKNGIISSHLIQWMEIKAYSLEHPHDSLAEISYNFSGTKTTLALALMNQSLT